MTVTVGGIITNDCMDSRRSLGAEERPLAASQLHGRTLLVVGIYVLAILAAQTMAVMHLLVHNKYMGFFHDGASVLDR